MSYKEYKVKVFEDGTRWWFLNGNLHREDGPAIEGASGTRKWFFKGRLHREDGPAIKQSNGDKLWCINGKLHREDGPAIEWHDGIKFYYLEGEKLTEDRWRERMKQATSCNDKIVEIDGRKYKLMEV